MCQVFIPYPGSFHQYNVQHSVMVTISTSDPNVPGYHSEESLMNLLKQMNKTKAALSGEKTFHCSIINYSTSLGFLHSWGKNYIPCVFSSSKLFCLSGEKPFVFIMGSFFLIFFAPFSKVQLFYHNMYLTFFLT